MRLAGERAIIVALHHPPLSADAHHGGSTGLQQDLDGACRAAGFWPDMILSGHAHLYQRFTMRPAGVSQEIPYIVSGCGGYAATPPVQKLGPAPITISDSSGQHTLECDPLVKFGYLLVTCDGKTLSSTFRAPANHGTVADLDTVSVDLATRKIRVTAKGKGGAPKPKTLPRKSPKKTPPAPAAALRGRSRSAASSVAAKVSRQP
jgi:hypothetical protein